MKKTLQRLALQGVRFFTVDDTLCCDAPAGVISPNLRQWIGDHKSDIVRKLTAKCESDVIAYDPETWPMNIRNFWNELSLRFESKLNMKHDDALFAAYLHISRGWIKLPMISIYQRADGSWPNCGLNADIEWVFNKGVKQ